MKNSILEPIPIQSRLLQMHFSKVTNMYGNMGRTVQILYQARSSFKSPRYAHSIGTKWKTLKKFW